jgi:hypothetical protein
MKKAGIFVFAIIIAANANDDLIKIVNGTLNHNLAKTKSTMALTSYSSSYFNLNYVCPTGWTITDTVNIGSSITLTVTSNNYLPTITISASVCLDNISAQ